MAVRKKHPSGSMPPASVGFKTMTPARLSLLCLVSLALAGCHNSTADNYAPGPIDPSLYNKALAENDQRLAGEDRGRPVYETPFHDIGLWFTHFGEWMSGDNASAAVRKLIDTESADNRRAGALRLADYSFARTGPSLKLYAHLTNDEDYTVRAAGLRALNRCRATGYTDTFVRCLSDVNVVVRLEAADALSNIPDPLSKHALLEHLDNDNSRDVRIACAEALRNYRDREVAQALADQLRDHDFGIAWQARQSLALLTGQDFRYDEQAWLDYFSTSKTFG